LKHIQIGPIRYTLEVSDFSDRTCGDTDTMKCRIRVNSTMHPDVQRVTLWHEVIHGILFAAGMSDHDEQVVDALAHGLVQVLRDNPKLRGDSNGRD
jgi:hypothetical protein